MGPVNLPFDSGERAEQFRSLLDKFNMTYVLPREPDMEITDIHRRDEFRKSLFRFAFAREFENGIAYKAIQESRR